MGHFHDQGLANPVKGSKYLVIEEKINGRSPNACHQCPCSRPFLKCKLGCMDKPQLVLHICCAPDEAQVVHSLIDRFDLTSFFCNPNISPAEEYQLRVDEAKRVAGHFNVPFTADRYDPDSWENAIVDVADTPEGGERCRRCFMIRLTRTAAFCRQNNKPRFATVMSISPHKNIKLLNECGTAAAREFGVAFEPFDFKKNDGFKKSVILSRELGLYRQDYCGCRLSKAESAARKRRRQMR
jgi:predicted adenine nucleotide alpha hydrolase (AANH) superfamily ATPase